MSSATPESEETRASSVPNPEYGKDWARPRAMKKDRNIGSWLIFLSGLCLIAACWSMIDRFYWRLHNRAHHVEQTYERTASNFVVLSYDGVTTSPQGEGTFISTRLFEEQLVALTKAGYRSITLEDVARFYETGRKLPKKAVLLTFENTQRSTYFTTRALLDKYHWNAVMGVVTGDVRAESESVILTPYLRDMVRSEAWELACQSDHGTGVVKANTKGREAMFFSSPAWLEKRKRYESLDEFTARITADHVAALADFTNNLSIRPVAFFFPKGNYGQFEPRNIRLREANLKAVEHFYRLGFAIDDFGYNDAASDRRRLNRLKIDSKWTTSEFMGKVEAAWPRPIRGGWGTRPEDSLVPSSRWRATWGSVSVLDGKAVTLRADQPTNPVEGDDGATGGAKAFVCGSNEFRDGVVSLKFHLVSGGFILYTHYKDSSDFVSFALNSDNGAILSKTVAGGEQTLLAREELDYLRNGSRQHDLTLIARGATLFVLLDGRMLFNGAVRVGHELPSAGFVGAGVWSPALGAAQADILEFHISQRRPQFITWDETVAENQAHIFRELEHSAYRYDHVAQPWIKASDGATIFVPTVDAEALVLVTEKTQANVWPIVRFSGFNPFDVLPMATITETLREHRIGGVVIDARALETESLPLMKKWVTGLQSNFADRRLPVAIAFPVKFNNSHLLSGFIGTIPDCRAIAENDIPLVGVTPDRIAGWLRIKPPISDDSELYFQLAEFDKRPADSVPGDVNFRRRLRKLFDEQNYKACEQQLALWRKREPHSPELWTFAARLNAKMHREGEACSAYGKSLEYDSAQIDVVIELADYLASIERSQDVVKLLDRYAKAFPENREISLAQAKWLDAHGHRPEARNILTGLVKRQPDNIDLRITRHSYLDDPVDRYENMRHIVDLVTRNDQNLMWFRQKIDTAGLLTYQESSLCFDFIRGVVTNSPHLTVRRAYAQLVPIDKPVVELFKIGRISSNWTLFGSAGDTMAGEYLLPKLPDPSEAHLRLLRSELLRDGFIEASNGDSMGAFWLYARRSNLGMVRFGYDNDGFLRIQAWQNGEMCSMDSVLWVRPKGDFTLRLETRGDGAVGYFNGKEVFSTPLSIPLAVGYGWWGVASSAAASGMAQTQLKRLAAGPISPTVVLMEEEGTNLTAQVLLDAVRPCVRDVSALSPVLCHQNSDGTLPLEGCADLIAYRMFCRYNRVRLMPAVALDYFAETPIDSIVGLVTANRLDSLALCVRRMPSRKWLEQLERTLEKHFVTVTVLLTRDGLWREDGGAGTSPVTVYEVQRGNLLFQPNQIPWITQAVDFSEWVKDAHHPDRREHIEPRIVVISRSRDRLPRNVEEAREPISLEKIVDATRRGDEAAWEGSEPGESESPKKEDK